MQDLLFSARKAEACLIRRLHFHHRKKALRASSPVSGKTLVRSYCGAQMGYKNKFFVEAEKADFSAFLAATGTSACLVAASEINRKPFVRSARQIRGQLPCPSAMDKQLRIRMNPWFGLDFYGPALLTRICV